MQTVCIKMENGILKDIDRKLKKHRYTTRTEFIRDAVRDKLSDLEKEKMLEHLDAIYGKFKHKKTTDKKIHEVGEKIFEEFERKFLK
ncbi:MAG: ribbon-helix-helix domain-containing protein [Nanoarchaeota archaeon]